VNTGWKLRIRIKYDTNNNNNNIYLLQLGCHPVAVVIYMYTKHEIGYY